MVVYREEVWVAAEPVADATGIDVDEELPVMFFWKNVANGFMSMNFTKRLTKSSEMNTGCIMFLPIERQA